MAETRYLDVDPLVEILVTHQMVVGGVDKGRAREVAERLAPRIRERVAREDAETARLLDMLACCADHDHNPFEPVVDWDADTSDLRLGSCSADGLPMVDSPRRSGDVFESTAYRPYIFGKGTPCPAADPMLGNCTAATFRPWKPASAR